jgi:thioredoxin 1
VLKLNVDENLAIAQKYGITSLPAQSIFRIGEIVKEIVGAKPKADLLRELAEFI